MHIKRGPVRKIKREPPRSIKRGGSLTDIIDKIAEFISNATSSFGEFASKAIEPIITSSNHPWAPKAPSAYTNREAANMKDLAKKYKGVNTYEDYLRKVMGKGVKLSGSSLQLHS